MKTGMTRGQTQDDMSRDRLDEDGVMGIKNWSSVNMANHNMKWRKARKNVMNVHARAQTRDRMKLQSHFVTLVTIMQ